MDNNRNAAHPRSSVARMTAAALLIAFVILLGVTPLGLIPLGFINVTILCVPVVTGAILLGWRAGLLLGFCFGTVSLASLLGLTSVPPSALASALLAASPAGAVAMCYLPRLLVPLAAHIAYNAMLRWPKARHIAPAVGAVAGSLTNTVLYLGLMLLFYALSGLETTAILALIGGIGLVAGGCEAAVAAIITLPVVMALQKTSVGRSPHTDGGNAP